MSETDSAELEGAASTDDFEQAFDAYASGEQPPEPEGDLAPEDESTSGQSDASDTDVPSTPEDEDTPVSDSEDLTERLKALEAENEKLRHAEASQRGRLGAYQRQINELQRKMQETESRSSGRDDSDAEKRQAAADAAGVEDWEALQSEFPEVAKALDARLRSEAEQREADRQRQAQLEQRIAELQSAVEPIQQQAEAQQLKREEEALTERHPDWREVVAAPAFAEWLEHQPERLRSLVESTNAAEAAALVDLYKSQLPPEQNRDERTDKRQERLAAAQSIPRRGGGQKSGVPEDFEAAFEHYAER